MRNPQTKTIEQRVDELFAAKAIVVKVGGKQHEYGVADIYDSHPGMADKIKKGLLSNCKSSRTDADIERYLKKALEVFQEGAVARTYYENVLREEIRIRDQELNPHKFDLKGFYRQVSKQMQQNNARGQGYTPSWDGFPRNDAPVRMSGATEAEIHAIKSGHHDGAFIDNPNKFYRNNVFDSEVSARDDIRVNNKRLENFIKNGIAELTPEEEQECRKHSRERHELSNRLQSIGALTLEAAKKLGKGLISSTDPSESSDYKKYADKRNDALYDMLYRTCPGKDRASFFHLLKSRNAGLIAGNDPMGAAMALEMNNALDQMIAQSEAEDKKRYEELQKKIEDGNKETLTGSGKKNIGLQGHFDKEDDAQKWTLMCAFVVLGPFATGIALGPIIGNLLGPVMMNGTFAQGLAALPTNAFFGPFGQFAELCHVPDLIQFTLEHVPIINQLSDIMDFATRNPVSAGLLEMGFPLLSSPLAALGMAGLAATYGLSSNYLNYTDKRDHMEAREKALKSLKEEFLKTGKQIQESRVESYAKNIIESCKRSHAVGRLAEFFCETDEKTLAALSKDLPPQKQQALINMKKSGLESPGKIIELVRGAGSEDPFVRNFLLFEGVGRDLQKFEAAMTNPAEKEKLINDQRVKFNNEYVSNWAASFNIKGFSTNSAGENIKYFESLMIEMEVNRLREVDLVDGPDPQSADPKTLEELKTRGAKDDFDISPTKSPAPKEVKKMGVSKSTGISRGDIKAASGLHFSKDEMNLGKGG